MLRKQILLAMIGLMVTVPMVHAQERADRVAAGEENAKRLLGLMDADKDGKVSKAEFMSFMEQVFDRLDVNKDGSLDTRELARFNRRSGIGNHR